MTTFITTPSGGLRGEFRLPSDKSISHRAVMLAAMCEGKTEVRQPLMGEDVRSTIEVMRACGATIEEDADGECLHIKGGNLRAPDAPLDCGNAGTLMRMFCGIAAGLDMPCKLIGDESLMQRPMKRVTAPLQQMGAVIRAAEKGVPPIKVGKRQDALHGILYSNMLCSAQVKGALLLAGLHAQGNTVIAEPTPSRDHSERMLELFGAKLRRSNDLRLLELTPGKLTTPGEVHVPADLSSAMFLIVAAAMSPESEIMLMEVGVNETRKGGLNILKKMGADISILNPRQMGGEPVGDILVRGGELHGIHITPEDVPTAIDDLPAILVAAATARGETRLTGAEELRHKECDRLSAMADGLQALGIQCEEHDDGIVIESKNGAKDKGNNDDGKPVFNSGEVNAEDDHRIAMAFAVASVRAKGDIRITQCSKVGTSFPNFVKVANACGIRLVEESD